MLIPAGTPNELNPSLQTDGRTLVILVSCFDCTAKQAAYRNKKPAFAG